MNTSPTTLPPLPFYYTAVLSVRMHLLYIPTVLVCCLLTHELRNSVRHMHVVVNRVLVKRWRKKISGGRGWKEEDMCASNTTNQTVVTFTLIVSKGCPARTRHTPDEYPARKFRIRVQAMPCCLSLAAILKKMSG